MKNQKKKERKQEEQKERRIVRQNFFGDSDDAYIKERLSKQGFLRGKKLG